MKINLKLFLPNKVWQIPSKSKFLVKSVNQQVTKVLSKQVGTSETLRPLTKLNFSKFKQRTSYITGRSIFLKIYKKKQIKKLKMMSLSENQSSNSTNIGEESWNEYLAGLIDGDGSLLISKEGYASLEITMDIHDEYALNKVKQKLGGSVKPRPLVFTKG